MKGKDKAYYEKLVTRCLTVVNQYKNADQFFWQEVEVEISLIEKYIKKARVYTDQEAIALLKDISFGPNLAHYYDMPCLDEQGLDEMSPLYELYGFAVVEAYDHGAYKQVPP